LGCKLSCEKISSSTSQPGSPTSLFSFPRRQLNQLSWMTMLLSCVGDVGGLKKPHMHIGKPTLSAMAMLAILNVSVTVCSFCSKPKSIGPAIEAGSATKGHGQQFFSKSLLMMEYRHSKWEMLDTLRTSKVLDAACITIHAVRTSLSLCIHTSSVVN